MGYEFLDDIATADIAFRVWGASREALFTEAAEAVLASTVVDVESVWPKVRRAISVDAETFDLLLHAFLQELIYLKDAEQLLLRVCEVTFSRPGDGWRATACGRGETIDARRHELLADIKAVTFYRFTVGETAFGWEATVVLDI